MKKFIFIFFISIILNAQQKKPEFKYQKIKDNFYLLQVYFGGNKLGANMGIYIGENELVVIDSHFSGLYPWLKNSFEKISNQKVKYLINTHWHPDHNSGNSFFKDEAVIVAHKNVLKRLSSSQKGIGLGKPGINTTFPARPLKDLPDITFENSLDLIIDSTKIKLRYFPNSHTDGDVVVFFDELKIVYLSDMYWPEEYPFIDVYTGGNVIGLKKSLEKIIDETDDDYVFISGHKTKGSRNDLKKYVKMIDKSISVIKPQLAKKKNYSEIEMRDLNAWSSDLVPDSVWVRMVAESL